MMKFKKLEWNETGYGDTQEAIVRIGLKTFEPYIYLSFTVFSDNHGKIIMSFTKDAKQVVCKDYLPSIDIAKNVAEEEYQNFMNNLTKAMLAHASKDYDEF